ncbi:MAG: FAD-dependent oxidoreductase [Clostridia bacterium]|nr:FAD-dependent oxidoreductase [Clostridia bacterium]
MEKLGFYYDAALCIGCRACQVACKEKNKLATGDFFRRVEAIEADFEGNRKWMFYSGACAHCSDPACVGVCPTGAMFIAGDGTVQHRNDLCIGCGRCVHSCPYGAVTLDKYTGYASKCDSCAQRRAEGREPACVEACPMRALKFGNISELREKYGDHGAELPFLPSPEVTHPNLMIKGAGAGLSCSEPETKAEPEINIRNKDTNVLVLGGGVSAITAAMQVRQLSSDAKITVVGREKRLPYSRPMLSKSLLHSFSIDRYPLVTAGQLAESNIEYISGLSVTALDPDAHSVTLSDGRALNFDKCIYALGMDCFVPPIEGKNAKNVFTLRGEGDLHSIRKAMLTAKRAAVIGGGITGLELAWEMRKAGLEVAVLDMADRLAGRILDSRTAGLLSDAVIKSGIDVVLNVNIASITDKAVKLADGTEYPCDIVIISTGYRANTSIAEAAGLNTDRGVVTDEHLVTSHPDILACGDCVSRGGATWLAAVRQGETAGANALGANLSFTLYAEPSIVHTCGTSLMAAGDMGTDPEKIYNYVYGHSFLPTEHFYINEPMPLWKETHFSFCLSDSKVCGAAMIGSLELMSVLEQAVNEGWTKDDLIHKASKKGIEINEK